MYDHYADCLYIVEIACMHIDDSLVVSNAARPHASTNECVMMQLSILKMRHATKWLDRETGLRHN